MSWPEWWFERRQEQIKNYPAPLVRFWRDFVAGVIDIVSEDGVVNYQDPEVVDAWVGPPWVDLRLEVSKEQVSAKFWTQRKGLSTLHLFDRTLKINGELCDLAELGIGQQDSAVNCGAAVGQFLFGLRTLNQE